MPGTSGLVSPFVEMNGLYFDDSNEVDNFSYELDKDLIKKFDNEKIPYITIHTNNETEFYDKMLEFEKFNDSIIATGTAAEGSLNIVEDDIKDMDEASTISHPKKKKADKEREEREALEKQKKLEEEAMALEKASKSKKK